MSEEIFTEAASLCDLAETTYTYRDGWFVDEPLVDFSAEQNPQKARECFDEALDEVFRRMASEGAASASFIWEWKT